MSANINIDLYVTVKIIAPNSAGKTLNTDEINVCEKKKANTDLIKQPACVFPYVKRDQTNSNFASVKVREALKNLGLRESATKLEIEIQYKKLLKKYHPDRNGGDRSFELLLEQIQEAYRVLIK